MHASSHKIFFYLLLSLPPLQAIAVIVDTYRHRGLEEGQEPHPAFPLSNYSLLVAEDDGTLADSDFPEVCIGRLRGVWLRAHPAPHPNFYW